MKQGSAATSRRPNAGRPGLEALEDRRLLSGTSLLSLPGPLAPPPAPALLRAVASVVPALSEGTSLGVGPLRVNSTLTANGGAALLPSR